MIPKPAVIIELREVRNRLPQTPGVEVIVQPRRDPIMVESG
jgi:hypothetical protein